LSRNGFISMAVIRRLPRYYRYLNEMYLNGVKQISSRDLADCMELTASQVRQDFNCFGDFGQQGCGYDVEALNREITKILGLDAGYRIVIMGAGRMGRALIDNFGFERRGFNLIAAFDVDQALIGTAVNGVPIYDVKDIGTVITPANKPDIGVLTVPRDKAQEGASYLKDCGVKAIWNFTNEDLPLIEAANILVENVHISDSLTTLCYRLTDLENKLYGE
jgi:redox-sensing transcriptional repressor